ncbi:tRNA pseudouridine(55) synthase TruB [Polaribacter sp.]|mgnify:FL=1|jgi:tRNA pseudouridine55 synthase|nr:tRNA pseudouridine(55) synthase TruB [Polaribacter sp.]MDA9976739.1 tRNA pseudouridine(55) synthase TruB [Polaribacter sp.]MDB0025650.1 tRNA pseudouridine(55) synthase TruB [Polaribacter sp.]MDB0040409.1 tRNA pseudouridine(55) synthase TruB [Polaribacter sp.]MDB4167200.1 tRNA pseudouridine(55) synthase TruB [Polaribacter sp.]
MTEEAYKNGQILLIDKPLKWTSFQAVNKIRWHIKQRFQIKKIKVGHAGTLDPLASGLLIICTGKQTKEIHVYQGQEKEYTGTITIGATTPSYDLETEIDNTFPTAHITKELIHDTTKQFLGEIDQKPPIFSAIKKEGKRLYELARKGETAEIKSRKVTIDEFEITNINLPNIDFRVVCSKGTYIRSLAYDFGKALHSGGHLSALRRTKIGAFSVEKAKSIEDFIKTLEAK